VFSERHRHVHATRHQIGNDLPESLVAFVFRVMSHSYSLAGGCGASSPASNSGRARRRAPIPERSVVPPRRGRVHSQEGAAEKARGGIGCKPVSPRTGAPKARLAAKEETRQAASPSWRP